MAVTNTSCNTLVIQTMVLLLNIHYLIQGVAAGPVPIVLNNDVISGQEFLSLFITESPSEASFSTNHVPISSQDQLHNSNQSIPLQDSNNGNNSFPMDNVDNDTRTGKLLSSNYRDGRPQTSSVVLNGGASSPATTKRVLLRKVISLHNAQNRTRNKTTTPDGANEHKSLVPKHLTGRPKTSTNQPPIIKPAPTPSRQSTAIIEEDLDNSESKTVVRTVKLYSTSSSSSSTSSSTSTAVVATAPHHHPSHSPSTVDAAAAVEYNQRTAKSPFTSPSKNGLSTPLPLLPPAAQERKKEDNSNTYMGNGLPPPPVSTPRLSLYEPAVGNKTIESQTPQSTAPLYRHVSVYGMEHFQRNYSTRLTAAVSRPSPTNHVGISETGPHYQAKVYSEPAKIYSVPAKIYSEPAKIYSEPAKIYSEPAKIYSEPAKIYSEPAKVYSQAPLVSLQQPEQSKGFDVSNSSSDTASIRRLLSNDDTQTKIHVGAPTTDLPANSPAKASDSANAQNIALTEVGEQKGESLNNTKTAYVYEGRLYRKYRVEEKTPDGFIVGEYGVVRHNDGSLRGVRYTADSETNPKLIQDALLKFLSL